MKLMKVPCPARYTSAEDLRDARPELLALIEGLPNLLIQWLAAKVTPPVCQGAAATVQVHAQ